MSGPYWSRGQGLLQLPLIKNQQNIDDVGSISIAKWRPGAETCLLLRARAPEKVECDPGGKHVATDLDSNISSFLEEFFSG